MKKLSFLLLFILFVPCRAAAFVPRLVAPEVDNPYYTTLNIFHKYGYGMAQNGGNCTCYAYGRAYEILKSEPRLSTGNAGKWFDFNKSGGYYEYGKKAAVGAIAVWKNISGGAGHVAVVEKIEGDVATTSESGWNSYYFKTVKRDINHKNFGASSKYIFQGFIYLLGSPEVKMEATLSRIDGKAEIYVKTKNANENSNIIIVAYKGKKLLETKVLKNENGEIKAVFDGRADSFKVMLREKDNLTFPLIKAKELK